MIVLLGFIGFLFLVGLYVWSALVTMNMLKGMNYKYYWFAFIPFLNVYAMADVVPVSNDGKVYITRTIGVSKDLFRLWWLLSLGLGFIPFIGSIASLVVSVICLYRIYTFLFAIYDYKSESDEVLMAILSIFIPFVYQIKGSMYFGKVPQYQYTNNI